MFIIYFMFIIYWGLINHKLVKVIRGYKIFMSFDPKTRQSINHLSENQE